uniref:Uncharacterized protein n=2 Tax=Candidatus Kentrum sp. UNK TaxID=2126344 RepID=A0A451B503_9GAMM|nr:MAG: hypothetical protein BECKUNK1418H_GA0071006_11924 [Candidatus Kentron sp. UNK]
MTERVVDENLWFRLGRVRMEKPQIASILTLMKRVPITLENETTTPVGRVVGATGRSPLLRLTRQKCIKNVGLRRLRA